LLIKDRSLYWLRVSEPFVKALPSEGVPDKIVAGVLQFPGKTFGSEKDLGEALEKKDIPKEEWERSRGKVASVASRFPGTAPQLAAAIESFQPQFQPPSAGKG
jgi:hypothetical protein